MAGIIEETDMNEPTRLALASAVLNGSAHRHTILEKFKYRYCAAAPERGIDVRRLQAVCEEMERREMGYRVFVVFVAIIAVIAAPDAPVISILAVLATVPVFAFKVYWERFVLAPRFTAEGYDQEALDRDYPLAQSVILEDASVDRINVIVYKGFVPFAFAGDVTARVTFSVDVSRGCEGRSPQRVAIPELYEAVADAIAGQGTDGLRQKDCLLVSGQDVRRIHEILPNPLARPRHHLEENQVRQWEGCCDNRVRHYRWIEVASWDDELIVSYFLRYALRGNALYCEIVQCVLTPPSDRYRRVDRLRKFSVSELISWWLWTAGTAPFGAAVSLDRLRQNSRGSWRTYQRRGRGAPAQGDRPGSALRLWRQSLSPREHGEPIVSPLLPANGRRTTREDPGSMHP